MRHPGPENSLHRKIGYGKIRGRLFPAFDAAWYLEQNPDVARAGADPRRHYLKHGAREGRNPHYLFHTNWYLGQVGGIDAVRNPLEHYLKYGRFRGLTPHPLFDVDWYCSGNPDVVAAGVDPATHFIVRGDKEARSPHPLFDPVFYLQHNRDVAESGIGPLRHFIETGGLQGRNPHPMFDSTYYFWLRPDVKEHGHNPLVHYLCAPSHERRHPHPLVDAEYQRATSSYGDNPHVDWLRDYILFRSHLDPALVARHATYIPAPTPVLLPDRSLIVRSKSRGRPLVSVLMPAYNSPEKYLAAAINSVRAQTYENWELIIVDDGSTIDSLPAFLDGFKSKDSRISVFRKADNTGISEATNLALSKAGGKYIICVDHDDVLLPDALNDLVAALEESGGDVCYADQASISASGNLESTFYKPDWSPTMFSGVMYVGHPLLVRRSLALKAGGFDKRYDRAQDFEFMLRVGERTEKVIHVPKILYHWRMIPGSIALDASSKGKVEPIQAAAVNAHLQRIGFSGEAEPISGLVHRLRINPTPRGSYPKTTLIFLDTLNEAEAENAENIDAKAEVGQAASKYISAGISGNGGNGKIPHANGGGLLARKLIVTSSATNSEYIALVDRTLQLADRWLDYLLMYAERPDVGFVGASIYDRSGETIASGLVLKKGEGLIPAMQGFRYGEDGYAGSLACDREVIAIPPGLTLVKRSVLDGIGGFDASFSSAFYLIGEASLRASLRYYRNISVAAPLVTAKAGYSLTSSEGVMDATIFNNSYEEHLTRGDKYYNHQFRKPGANYQ